MLNILKFGFVVICLLLTDTTLAHAQTMSNQDYIIRTNNFNSILDTNTVTSKSANIKTKTGPDSSRSHSSFSISISPKIVDFGIISPTNPVIRTVDLSVNSPTAYGYSVLVFENESPLATSSARAISIPDTTCDNGNCSAEIAAEWTNALTYGFGYRCDNITGMDCNQVFSKTNFYRHFSNLTFNDDPQSIMSGIHTGNNKIRISYKINTSVSQPKSVYGNIITYIAVPNY
jgi:hypothetical protein